MAYPGDHLLGQSPAGVSDGLCNKVTLQVKEYTDDYDGSQ
jgi:hypothetical protein